MPKENLEEINIRQLVGLLEKGISNEKFNLIKDRPIKDGTITAGKYISQQVKTENVEKTENGYKLTSEYGGGTIGVLVSTNGEVPMHFPNSKKHKTFVKNVFETSPYGPKN